MSDEFRLIQELRKTLSSGKKLPLAIGDDAGLVPGGGKTKWLLASDTIVEGVDFLAKTPAELVARKALAVNLSDLAAMGAEPAAYVISLGLPRADLGWVKRFGRGLSLLQRRYRMHCAGGDMTRAPKKIITVSVLGRARSGEIITRSGARAGDWIAVTGKLGGSIAGHHLNFTPRVQEGLFLARRFHPHAMIDISDGLLQDLGHVLRESGTGAELDCGRVPISKAAIPSARKSAIERALTDGEDFELLFCISPSRKTRLERAWKKKFPRVALSWIGRVKKSRRGSIRLFAGDKPFHLVKSKRKGYRHFGR